MTTRKVILSSLLVAALISIFICCKFIRQDDAGEGIVFTLIFVSFAWCIGLLLGAGLAFFIKKPAAKPHFYLSGQLAVMFAVVLTVMNVRYNHWKHQHDFGNIKDNHSFLNLENFSYENTSPAYIRTAFLKLESGFANPNSFHLERYTSRWQDTLINSASDTVYSVYFTYVKDKQVYFAKVRVFRDSAAVNSRDATTRPDKEDQSKNFGAWGRRGDLDDVNRDLKDLPDSTRNKVIDLLSH